MAGFAGSHRFEGHVAIDTSRLNDEVAAATRGLWNRRRDLETCERHLGLGASTVGGCPYLAIYCASSDGTPEKRLIATGFTRLLLGDHGSP
jgi:hypothetical protein|mmetsp:Transcript_1859/g.2945  ORF Transcript_1859/g.2945 Transcript_1859/m.2945 type:complete len:91 (+) Transcript_1859:363-635(+)